MDVNKRCGKNECILIVTSILISDRYLDFCKITRGDLMSKVYNIVALVQ
jgi:hypothetical protein